MPKRKAPEDSSTATEPSPPKRAVRRYGTRTACTSSRKKEVDHVAEEQAMPEVQARRTPHSNSPVDREGIRGSNASFVNDRHDGHHTERPQSPGDSDADELNIVPSSKSKPAEPSTPRVILECVEITTPKFVSKLRDLDFPAVASAKGTSQRPPVTPSRKGNPDFTTSAVLKPIAFPLTPSKLRTPASPQKTLQPLLRGTPTTPGRSPKKLSPSKNYNGQLSTQFPEQLPQVLPSHLGPCLRVQQRAILASLKSSSDFFVDDDGDDQQSPNAVVRRQLQDLLLGSTIRGEGNSCLVVGPRGSGKTSVR